MTIFTNIANCGKLCLKYAAFTLAEVLIVLGIIGIIAEMTIPTLMTNVEKQEYVVGLKKAYSETNQALKLMASDYGCTGDLKCTGLFDTTLTDQQNTLGDALVKYFRVSKNCRTDANQGCFTNYLLPNYDGSGTSVNNDAKSVYKFITADGMSFLLSNYKNGCLTDGTGGSINYSTGRTGDMAQTCAIVYVDVNGLKKPNIIGRDTFVFYITNGKGPMLYPCDGADSNYGGSEHWWKTSPFCVDSNKFGAACTARIMEEGWEMNY